MRENFAVTVGWPTAAATVNPKGLPTVTITAEYRAGRSVDRHTMQLDESSARELRDALSLVLDA